MGEPRALTGWGRTTATVARVTEPETAGPQGEDPVGQIERVLSAAGERGVVARGLGRSYGDAAQNAGGDVVLMTGLDRILDVDLAEATVTAEAGVSLDRLMRTLVPLGLWPAVTPGTRYVTVGGAIGSDVHGKGHHRDGTFGAHVRSMEIVAPGPGRMTLTPDGTPEEFWATTGGMGLTGIVHRATLELIRIETASIRVDSWRTPDLDTTMALMAEHDRSYRYSVAWIDCLARGSSLGRSIVEFGEHAARDDLPPGKRSASRALRFSPVDSLPAPPWAPSGLLNRWTVAAFNELWYRKARRRAEGHVVSASAFFHPLDMIDGWNRIYGARGFLQYQFVLPDGEEATLRRIIEELVEHRAASFLAVLKRFGPSNPAPLSFPRPGWTLALDLPVTFGDLPALLDRMDEQVVAAGGRIYLAKDSRLRPDLLEAMYPGLPRWREVRDRMDPDHTMRSDLLRRLPALAARADGSPAPAPAGPSEGPVTAGRPR
ncbi:MAG TPA: FAD-binding oxidoreductase [Acidimicrobiales bacterium]|nr:FAD-binding oxidoreductase [Acidimicrobiales bacterium]